MEGSSYSDRELKTLLVATSAGIFLAPFASTMLNLALVSIGQEFLVGSHSLGMVNTIFLLASVMSMVPMTRVADIYGLKKVFISGVLIMLVSLFFAALAPSFSLFLLARALMGVGTACLAVTSITMIVNAFPSNKRGWAIGINTTAVYMGTALGPTIGGVVTDIFGWRFLFYALVPLSIISLIMISHFKDEITLGKDIKMDYKGSVIYMVMILTLMYGMINLPEIWAFASMGVGGALLFVFLSYVKRAEHPVMKVNVYKNKVFRRSIIAAFMNYASSYSVSFFFALYLQTIGALSASQAGMIMLLQPLIQVLLTAKAGSLSDSLDKRLLPTLGMSITTLSVFLILFMGTEVNLWYVAMILLLLGLGYGLFSAPNTAAIMSSVSAKDRSLASGSVSLMRQTGMMTSMGIAMCCISVILGSTDNINPSTYGDFINVMKTAFSVCLVMCIIGTFVSWFRGKEDNVVATNVRNS